MAKSGAFAEVAHGVGIQPLDAVRPSALFSLPPLVEQQRTMDEAERRLADIAAPQGALASRSHGPSSGSVNLVIARSDYPALMSFACGHSTARLFW
jgi:hypothetical protein